MKPEYARLRTAEQFRKGCDFMFQKHTKVIIASLLAATMTASAVTQLAAPLTALAGQVLDEGTFEYKMVPWHLTAASPAKQNFNFEDGALHVQILVPEGAEKAKWDLQLKYPGLSFKKNHVYEVSFKVKASRAGMELCSKIGQTGAPWEEYFELDGHGMGEYGENSMHMGPDMDGQWGSPVKLTTEYQTFSGTFTPTRDLECVAWIFEYAKDSKGYGGNAQHGDELWFDDMSIICTTCNDCGVHEPPHTSYYGITSRAYSGLQNNFISVNQLGYYPQLAKIATFSDNAGDDTHNAETLELTEETYPYEIVDNTSGKTVYTGTTGKGFADEDSGDRVYKIDFSEFRTPGEYYLRIKDTEWRSFPFRIGNDIYQEKDHDMLTNALNYFYQNRSGVDITQNYITSGEKSELAHAGGHKKDTATVQTAWRGEYLDKEEATTTYGSSKIDVTGGWYNAENHSKYMTEGGISVWTLQNMYERAYQNADGKEKFADGSGTVVVPETENMIPDILDECRYELDFMQKMKVAEDEPTWGDYAGLYYHAVKDHKWTGLAVRPWDYETEWKTVRIVSPPTFAATLNYAACAAQAARLWADYDAEYAAQLMQSAKEAYAAYKQHLYTPDRDENVKDGSLYAPLSYGYYGERDTQINDDAYWAACELYISAKALEDSAAADYLKELSESAYAFDVPAKVSGGDNNPSGGSCTCFNMGNPAAAGSLSLALHRDLLSNEQKEKLGDAIRATADEYIKKEAAQGYGIPYENDGYGYFTGADPFDYNPIGFEYGSNAMTVYNMIAMAYAYDLTGDTKYMNGISAGMDYLLGNNPMAFSFVTGYGQYGTEKPVHRYWCYELDKTLPKAPDGILVGGPDASSMDEYMRAIGFVPNEFSNKSERCYADSVESWASNGIALQWNAPFAWIVSFLQDEVPGVPVPVTPTDPPETTEPPVQTTEPGSVSTVDPGVSKWGDITCDNSVDVADAVLLARFLNQDVEAQITDQGLKNANVVSGQLDSDDISAILLCIAKQIPHEQFPLAKLPSAKG